MQAPKTRNRARKPAWTFSGLTATEWKLSADLVKWAQDAPQFRGLVTLLVNDRGAVLDGLPPASENRLLGRHEAYEAVRLHLLSLADGPHAPDETPRAPTYEPETSTVETDFVNQDD